MQKKLLEISQVILLAFQLNILEIFWKKEVTVIFKFYLAKEHEFSETVK